MGAQPACSASLRGRIGPVAHSKPGWPRPVAGLAQWRFPGRIGFAPWPDWPSVVFRGLNGQFGHVAATPCPDGQSAGGFAFPRPSGLFVCDCSCQGPQGQSGHGFAFWRLNGQIGPRPRAQLGNLGPVFPRPGPNGQFGARVHARRGNLCTGLRSRAQFGNLCMLPRSRCPIGLVYWQEDSEALAAR